MYCVVDSHIQRIILAIGETTVTQQVSPTGKINISLSAFFAPEKNVRLILRGVVTGYIVDRLLYNAMYRVVVEEVVSHSWKCSRKLICPLASRSFLTLGSVLES